MAKQVFAILTLRRNVQSENNEGSHELPVYFFKQA